jgi:hypothetical protein
LIKDQHVKVTEQKHDQDNVDIECANEILAVLVQRYVTIIERGNADDSFLKGFSARYLSEAIRLAETIIVRCFPQEAPVEDIDDKYQDTIANLTALIKSKPQNVYSRGSTTVAYIVNPLSASKVTEIFKFFENLLIDKEIPFPVEIIPDENAENQADLGFGSHLKSHPELTRIFQELTGWRREKQTTVVPAKDSAPSGFYEKLMTLFHSRTSYNSIVTKDLDKGNGSLRQSGPSAS